MHTPAERVLRGGAINLPQLFIARYLAQDVLSSGNVVPVRMSLEPPVIPLPYSLEHTAEALLPDREMLGEWPRLSRMFWKKLDRVGFEKIGEELAIISRQHNGKPLALLDYEDVTRARGHKSPRVVFAAWYEEQTGQPVPELTNDGERLHYTELHKQVQPKRPKTSDP